MKICEQCKKKRSIPENRKLCVGCRRFNSEVAKGNIRKPDYADVVVSGYKEPMTRVEDGYSYYGAITATKDGEHIQCHLCGFFFGNLSAHITFKHEMNVQEYKVMFGLRLKEGLVSPNLRENLQERYNETLREQAPKNAIKAQAKQREMRKEGKLKTGGNMWTEQSRNEHGNCRKQTLAKIQEHAERNEGFAVLKDFECEYGYGQGNVVKNHFGSWKEACRLAGVQDGYAKRKELASRFNTESAIAAAQAFYERHGRTPQTADFNNDPTLPYQERISQQFGSLNNFRELAGIPKLVKVGGFGATGQWVEQI